MTKPSLQTVLALLALLGGLIAGTGGIVAYAHTTFATQDYVAGGLEGVIQKINSDRCAALLSEMTMLETREARGDLTEAQEERLIWVRNQYEAHCTGQTG